VFLFEVSFIFIILAFLMIVSWYALKVLFPNDPKLRVFGIFGCSQKSVATGIPLINAIYEGNPKIGLYILPLIIWHPMQLVFGSLLVPFLSKFVDREMERLGIVEVDDDDDTNNNNDDEENKTFREDEGDNALKPNENDERGADSIHVKENEAEVQQR
jgi:hypothetical protein